MMARFSVIRSLLLVSLFASILTFPESGSLAVVKEIREPFAFLLGDPRQTK